MPRRNLYYGSVSLVSDICPECGGRAFIIDGRFACCGLEADEELPTESHKISDSDQKRKKPSTKLRDELVSKQNNCCSFCGRVFGSWVFRHNKPVQLRVCIDHLLPKTYSQDDGVTNLNAVCQVCNLLKSDFVLDNPGKIRRFLKRRWAEKGYSDEIVDRDIISGRYERR